MKPLQPNIHGLRELFLEQDEEEWGFLPGSALVISGPPGAGKTTFALALIRSLLELTTTTQQKTPRHLAYYISMETDENRLRRMYRSRGWFDSLDDDIFKTHSTATHPCGLRVVVPPMEMERPVKNSEEIVNYFVREIAAMPALEKGQKVHFIVDSLTSITKDCLTPGEERRQVYELISRLRGMVPEAELGLMIFLCERTEARSTSEPHFPGVEDYVADVVFHLDAKSQQLGGRLRTLEVTKSQAVNIMMGKHTWAILDHEGIGRVVEGDSLNWRIRRRISEVEKRDVEDLRRFGTIMICPRPHFRPEHAFPYRGTSIRRGDSSSGDLHSGMPGLDEMLNYEANYWFHARPALEKQVPRSQTSIKRGTTTLIVGEAGTGKTSFCLHFVLADVLNGSLKKYSPALDKSPASLLVSFVSDPREAVENFKTRLKKYTTDPRLPIRQVRIEAIYRPRSTLHFNLLLSEILAWRRADHEDRPLRVAIDGLSSLMSSHAQHEFSTMMDALIAAVTGPLPEDRAHLDELEISEAAVPQEHEAEVDFAEADESAAPPRSAKPVPTLMLTFEAELSDTIFESEAFRLNVDNIAVLALRDIKDERHHSVLVIKSSHADYDRLVRELHLDKNPFRTQVWSGFDAFTGLLSDKLEPAEIVLQIFYENLYEKRYGTHLKRHLSALYPYRFKSTSFSRNEIATTLIGMEQAARIPRGDVRILTLDEWWVAYQIEALRLGTSSITSRVQLANLKHLFVKNQSERFSNEDGSERLCDDDFWCFELEKARIKDLSTQTKDQPSGSASPPGSQAQETPSSKDSEKSGIYAVPGYLDFGMLCVHSGLVKYWGSTTDVSILEKAHHSSVKAIPLRRRSKKLRVRIGDKLPWRVPGKASKRAFKSIESELQKPWCALDKSTGWFKAPDPSSPTTLVDLMQRVKEKTPKRRLRPAFAWDSRSPETAACFFVELAWAFGGSEAIFEKKVTYGSSSANEDAFIWSLKFLIFLVKEGLMSRRPSLTETAEAAFSRHFFSTMMDVNQRLHPVEIKCQKLAEQMDNTVPKEPAPAEAPQGAESRASIFKGILIGLSFVPAGPTALMEKAAYDDEFGRITRLMRRIARRSDDDSVAANADLIEAKHNEEFSPGKLKEDSLTDPIYQRAITRGQKGSNPNFVELYEWCNQRQKLRDGDHYTVGHPCCGAWMYGVHLKSSSPNLAGAVIQEICSLDQSKERARRGAGLPARIDFYSIYGKYAATGMPWLSYQDMLRRFGSMARRRDRLYHPFPPPSSDGHPINDPMRLYAHLHEVMLQAMDQGDMLRGKDLSPEEVKNIDTWAKSAWETACELETK